MNELFIWLMLLFQPFPYRIAQSTIFSFVMNGYSDHMYSSACNRRAFPLIERKHCDRNWAVYHTLSSRPQILWNKQTTSHFKCRSSINFCWIELKHRDQIVIIFLRRWTTSMSSKRLEIAISIGMNDCAQGQQRIEYKRKSNNHHFAIVIIISANRYRAEI